MAKTPPIIISEEEQDFQRKNQWYSFTGHLYSAIGGAAFFGLLGLIATSAVALAVGPAAGGAFEMASAIIQNSLPKLAIGGLMAIGTASIYMAQKEFTKLKCVQDLHMAQENARHIGVVPGMAPEAAKSVACDEHIEYPQNERADGKSWSDVVSQHTGQSRAAIV